jgi:hypothetical protein
MQDPFLSFLDPPTLLTALGVHPRFTTQIRHVLLLRVQPPQVRFLDDFLKFQWAYLHGYTLSPRLYLFAAEQGHIEMLEWLDLTLGVPSRHDHTCTLAVMHGQFETLKYLRSRTPPYKWDAETCAKAVRHKRFDILKWLRSEGCPWNWTACLGAVETKNYKVLEWLRMQDPPCPWERPLFRPPQILREPGQWVLQFFELRPFRYVRDITYPCMEHATREKDQNMVIFLKALGSPAHYLSSFIYQKNKLA